MPMYGKGKKKLHESPVRKKITHEIFKEFPSNRQMRLTI